MLYVYTAKFYRQLKYKYQSTKEAAKIIHWSRKLSYLLGIIASDGTLRKDRKLIKISSNDYDLLEEIRDFVYEAITGSLLKIKCNKKTMNGKIFYNYTYAFTSELFYNFCLDIGIIPNKSLTLGELKIPDAYFSDFLRGVIDGDGGYNIIKRNYPVRTIFYINTRIISGSFIFLSWLNQMVFKNLGFYGSIVLPKGNLNTSTLFWSKDVENNEIFKYIYSNCDIYLHRKWRKLQDIKEFTNDTHEFIRNNNFPKSSLSIEIEFKSNK